MFDSISEVMKGLTDLPIALLALIFGVLLRIRKRDAWATLFLLVAVSGLMGAAVHVFLLPNRLLQILWMILYVLLFEDIRRFTKLMVAYIHGSDAKEQTLVWAAEGILYLLAAVLLFVRQGQDIYMLVVFMAIMFCRIVVCLVRRALRPKKAAGLVCLILVPILLQALADLIPGAVVMEHLVLLAAEFVAYSIGAEHKTESAPVKI